MNKQSINQAMIWPEVAQRGLIAASLGVSLWVLSFFLGEHPPSSYILLAVMASLMVPIFLKIAHALAPWFHGRFIDMIKGICLTWLMLVSALWLVAWLSDSVAAYATVLITVWLALAPIVMVSAYYGSLRLWQYFAQAVSDKRTAVIIGNDAISKQLAEALSDPHSTHPARFLGFFADDTDDADCLGAIASLADYVREHGVHEVYFTAASEKDAATREVLNGLYNSTASIFMVPDLSMMDLLGAKVKTLNGLPVFALCESTLTGPFGILKRVEDVLLSVLILALIWPVLLFIGLAVRWTSPGDALFKQRRYGLNGEVVWVWKFRSMGVCEDGADTKQATKNDPRVTPLGAFLRRTSLDELPQFINVLQGQLSIVGPRPHPIALNEEFREKIQAYMWRHKVKPGITGWAQINGWRGETDTMEKMEKRVEYDLEYIRRWSIWFDLKIIFLTLFKGFVGKNAY